MLGIGFTVENKAVRGSGFISRASEFAKVETQKYSLQAESSKDTTSNLLKIQLPIFQRHNFQSSKDTTSNLLKIQLPTANA